MITLELDDVPVVVTAGVPLFSDALTQQAAEPISVDWAPPAGGASADLAAIAADLRAAEATVESARRLTTARAHWVDVVPAHEALGLTRGEFLHAGPPTTWATASGPLRGALIGAMIYEGLADSVEEAERLGASDEISLAPCHSRGAVGPMAGVVSASMPVSVLHDEVHGKRAYCTLNEGLGKVLRFGAYAPEVIERLRWMEHVLGPLLRWTLRKNGPVDIPSVLAQALQMGDEGHNRNRAATSLLLREITPALLETEASRADIKAVYRFISGNDHFFLNLSMPAGKAAADAARDIPGSRMVVAMARNGTDFGIQVSGTGDEWFTAPAPVVDGLYFPGFSAKDANPDLGDSTITETSGIGGFAMAAAPAIVRFVGGEAADALRNTLSMYEITVAEHPLYQVPVLGFRGTPSGIDATLVVRTGIVPVVNTGIAGREPGVGQVGAGLVTPPMSVFVDAVHALAQRVR
ncbi:MAG TPA: DUF1116 domain-containing protein [Jatrophihabitans sp.]|jgi:hypothetical protein|nr:DUF1116 domain-containing protein [Jatrophihabitans sp.]